MKNSLKISDPKGSAFVHSVILEILFRAFLSRLIICEPLRTIITLKRMIVYVRQV